jgi:hypothetical protein
LILGYLTRRSLSKTSDQPDEITELQRESQVLLEEANAISESLHTGDPEDVRSLELWAETHYNMALLQFDRKEFKSVGDITIDLVEHVQTEHARGVQNQRSVAILNAARELQRISADRE